MRICLLPNVFMYVGRAGGGGFSWKREAQELRPGFHGAEKLGGPRRPGPPPPPTPGQTEPAAPRKPRQLHGSRDCQPRVAPRSGTHTHTGTPGAGWGANCPVPSHPAPPRPTPLFRPSPSLPSPPQEPRALKGSTWLDVFVLFWCISGSRLRSAVGSPRGELPQRLPAQGRLRGWGAPRACTAAVHVHAVGNSEHTVRRVLRRCPFTTPRGAARSLAWARTATRYPTPLQCLAKSSLEASGARLPGSGQTAGDAFRTWKKAVRFVSLPLLKFTSRPTRHPARRPGPRWSRGAAAPRGPRPSAAPRSAARRRASLSRAESGPRPRRDGSAPACNHGWRCPRRALRPERHGLRTRPPGVAPSAGRGASPGKGGTCRRRGRGGPRPGRGAGGRPRRERALSSWRRSSRLACRNRNKTKSARRSRGLSGCTAPGWGPATRASPRAARPQAGPEGRESLPAAVCLQGHPSLPAALPKLEVSGRARRAGRAGPLPGQGRLFSRVDLRPALSSGSGSEWSHRFWLLLPRNDREIDGDPLFTATNWPGRAPRDRRGLRDNYHQPFRTQACKSET
ncbi:PREDICTED: translation initiation factor IF-2-like [Chinchilla lanigera]|uniref:translation initiation factor IF-2-like n=1 Tax=Chinchilla lanigera TaxID=34839 RepID=UPI000697DE3B|nr:PREDICTED: translation initiation factor IF-2-like [Chinchilla lanigera]